MKALVFPGQGSQRRGMGAGLFERFPELTRRADAVLGYSVAELCRNDPEGKLSLTRYAQPAIFVVNALHFAALQESGECDAQYAAGHSLGEYSALLASGAVDFDQALGLVKARGEAFEAAGEGAMAAILGLKPSRVRAVIENSGVNDVDIANFNTDDQVVIAGSRRSLNAVRAPLEEAGCSYFRLLDVSGAFHSRRMRAARQAMAPMLRRTTFCQMKIPVIANVTSRPYDAGRIADFLIEQIDNPVRWAESVRYLLRQGVDDFCEIGDRKILTGMIAVIRKDAAENKACL